MRKLAIIVFSLWFSVSLILSTGFSSVLAAPLPKKPTGDPYRPGVLIVGYRETGAPRVMSLPDGASIAANGGGLEKIDAVVLQVPQGQEDAIAGTLQQDPNVLYVERDARVYADFIPNDPRWDQQYGPSQIQAPDAWDITTGSSSVVLAVLDSGIDAGHPEFAGRLVVGHDFVDGDSTPQDGCGHGTHVAGIAAATGNNGIGVAGINWRAKIMPVRVLDRSCSGWISDVADGVIYAVTHGAKVINLSLGTSAGSPLLENAMYYAYQNGVAVFAAAGNDGMPYLYYPANYQWVMGVGAVDSSNQLAWFSNTSNVPNQMMVVAPGVDILSTTPRGSFMYNQEYGVTKTYGELSGTSMATPFVAGAAALLAGDPVFNTPDKIYQALYKTTLDLGTPGWDRSTGYGLIQISNALGFSDFAPPPPAPPVPDIEYDILTSDNCGQVSYNWVEIGQDKNFVPIFGQDDLVQVKLDPGVTFSFAGQTYNSLYVSANGYVIPGDKPSSYYDKVNYPIPWISEPNNMIDPLWADLSTSVGGHVYAAQVGNTFVIEWYRVSFQGYGLSQSELTFEAILNLSSGVITFQYKTLKGAHANGSLGTVGLEYASGTAGAQYSYNRAGALQAGLAVAFFPATPGETRTVQNCLFKTQSELTSCDQLPPFGVNIFEGLVSPDVPTTLTIQSLAQHSDNAPEEYLPLNHYARIDLKPSPPVPFNPKPLVCYQYTAADILKAGGSPKNLFIAGYDTSNHQWKRMSTFVDASISQLSAQASHFSDFGVFALQPQKLPVTGSPFPVDWMWIGGVSILLSISLWVFTRTRR